MHLCCVECVCLTQESKEEPRRSKRSKQEPVHYGEEQAQQRLHAEELLDLHRALAASLVSDDELSISESDGDTTSSSDSDGEEEEEKKEPPVDDWKEASVNVHLPPFDAPTGKQHGARHATSPLEYFQLFLSPALMQQIVDYTNAYAQQQGAERGWRTTVSELYTFIGVYVYMGICNLPHWHMYWSKEYEQSFITSVFTRWRYEQLIRYFSVAPPESLHDADDLLSSVRPLIESLQHSFPHHYLPSRYIVFDEAMVAFKGRSPIKQYIPMKPHKWGIKIWCVASDNYLLRFEVYLGKSHDASEAGVTFDTVMRMTQPYQNQQYILFTDSYFTSPALMNALKEKGIYTCGSVRRNRKGLPSIPKRELKSLRQGQWISKNRSNMSFVAWKDKKPVLILYNHISSAETSSLRRWNDAGTKVDIGCPTAVKDYFFHSHSVDIINQLHYSYLIGRKSRRMLFRLLWWLVDMCIVNAFTLWSIDNRESTHLSFRETLMHALWKLSGINPDSGQRSAGSAGGASLAHQHYSEHTEEERECVACSQRPQHRVRTRFMCAKCRVHLCVGKCFAHYHM